MADGSMNLSMSPETNRSDGGNLRRFSMVKASSLSIDEQNSSRDRRSSTGSCHDFCKYGHKHSLETKARVPLLKRAMKKSLDVQSLDQAVVVLEKKHSVHVTMSKASPSSKTCITSSTDARKRVVATNSHNRRCSVETEVMSKSKKRVVLVKFHSSRQNLVEIEATSESSKELVVPVNSPSMQSPTEIDVISETKELKMPVNSPSRQSSVEIEVSNESKDHVMPEKSPTRRSSVENEGTSKSAEPTTPESSPSGQSPNRRSPLKSEVVNESKVKTKSMPITPKPQIHKTTKQVVYSYNKSESSPKQALTSIREAGGGGLLKLKALKAKSVTSSFPSGNIVVHRNNGSKSGDGAGILKGNGTKVVGNSIVTSDPNSVNAVAKSPVIKNKNSNVVSRVLSWEKTRRAQTNEASSVELQEKTLHVINMETKKTKHVESGKSEKLGLKGFPKSPSSVANNPSLSHLRGDSGGTKDTKREMNATFSVSNKHGGIKKEDDRIDVKKGGLKNENYHNGVKKGRSPRIVQTKGKDSLSFNLSFKNLKAVDLHSKSNGPTRLKFMQGKSLGDNQKSKDGQRTSLKKVRIVKGISKNSTPTYEKVVLQHQDVQGKKDTQVLFNNVIAETARKLVRTRKSKVKALVGAFEKVISLQDKNPSLRDTT